MESDNGYLIDLVKSVVGHEAALAKHQSVYDSRFIHHVRILYKLREKDKDREYNRMLLENTRYRILSDAMVAAAQSKLTDSASNELSNRFLRCCQDLFPQVEFSRPEDKKSVSEQEKDDWAAAFGDPNSPEVQARIEAFYNAAKQGARRPRT